MRFADDESEKREEKPLIVILGPTGSGKSGLALALACEFAGEIVSCDSVQVYEGLDIGSAKTPIHERRGVAHHLIDVAGCGVDFTAGDYSRAAREAIAGIAARGKLPIVCGGTGLYLRALLSGLSPAPARDWALRARLNKVARRRPSALHRLLKGRDELAAARIHRNDLQKLIRAIEITYLASEPVSDVQSRPREFLPGYRVLKIGLDPDCPLLHHRLNERSASMFRSGLIEETNQLLAAGYEPNSKALQSLGYRQALQVIRGQLSVDDAVQQCQTKTRQYAKRQRTWFRAEKNVHWLKGFGESKQLRAHACSLARQFLAGNL